MKDRCRIQQLCRSFARFKRFNHGYEFREMKQAVRIVSDEKRLKKKKLELEAHYGFWPKIQGIVIDERAFVPAAECVNERAALANLIANLTLDTEENKMILKKLKKANASLTQELKECKTNLDESSRALGEATSSLDSSLIALQTKQS
ncbi:hypothetical protein Tco_0401494 [Tanacetum coccineum]